MTTITAKYKSLCHGCKDTVNIGEEVLYDAAIKKVFHPKCDPERQGNLLDESDAEQLADKLGFSRE